MERADFNIIDLDHVYHVGTLNVSDRNTNFKNSFEGHCLSVSLCPHAWVEIAKLGGYELHKLSKRSGRFLDVQHITNSPKLYNEIVNWAVSEGIAVRKSVFKAWYFDEDNEGWSYLLAETKESAISEVNLDDDESFNPDGPGPDGRQLVEPTEIVTGTEKLWKEVGAKLDSADDATDMILIAFARSKAADVLGFEVDGVWWDEEYAPERLSAPRGGILPERLQTWEPASCSFDEVEDLISFDDLEASISPSPQ